MSENKRKMKLPPEPEICVIGTGFAGLCAGLKLKDAGYDKLTVYETNNEVGGTWLVNRYPGCACDIPSHLYSFSFAPKAGMQKLFVQNLICKNIYTAFLRM